MLQSFWFLLKFKQCWYVKPECKVGFIANVANCNTWLFLPSVPSFLAPDSFSALTCFFALTSCMWVSCVSATVFEGFSSLPATEVRLRVANLISPVPRETAVLKVVWVKESEEIGCDHGTSKNMLWESTWAEDSAGERGGEADVEEDFRNMLGKLTPLLAERSFLCLCS